MLVTATEHFSLAVQLYCVLCLKFFSSKIIYKIRESKIRLSKYFQVLIIFIQEKFLDSKHTVI